jgi:hypothetical protein
MHFRHTETLKHLPTRVVSLCFDQGGFDVMSLPGVNTAVKWTTEVRRRKNSPALGHTDHQLSLLAVFADQPVRTVSPLDTFTPQNLTSQNFTPQNFTPLQYVIKQLLLYPNSISVPVMKNFGAPTDPVGMIHVKLHRWVATG